MGDRVNGSPRGSWLVCLGGGPNARAAPTHEAQPIGMTSAPHTCSRRRTLLPTGNGPRTDRELSPVCEWSSPALQVDSPRLTPSGGMPPLSRPGDVQHVGGA